MHGCIASYTLERREFRLVGCNQILGASSLWWCVCYHRKAARENEKAPIDTGRYLRACIQNDGYKCGDQCVRSVFHRRRGCDRKARHRLLLPSLNGYRTTNHGQEWRACCKRAISCYIAGISDKSKKKKLMYYWVCRILSARSGNLLDADRRRTCLRFQSNETRKSRNKRTGKVRSTRSTLYPLSFL